MNFDHLDQYIGVGSIILWRYNTVYSRPVALLATTMETVRQTNQLRVTTGYTLYLTNRVYW